MSVEHMRHWDAYATNNNNNCSIINIISKKRISYLRTENISSSCLGWGYLKLGSVDITMLVVFLYNYLGIKIEKI